MQTPRCDSHTKLFLTEPFLAEPFLAVLPSASMPPHIKPIHLKPYPRPPVSPVQLVAEYLADKEIYHDNVKARMGNECLKVMTCVCFACLTSFGVC